MIRIIGDLAGIVGFEASGEVSAEDYRQALEALPGRATSGSAGSRASTSTFGARAMPLRVSVSQIAGSIPLG
jgi:hypothetical protein